MAYTIGLDVHKRETQACIVDETGAVVAEKRFPTRSHAFRRALKDYPASTVILESVGMHRPVVKWLQEEGHEALVAFVGDQRRPRIKHDRKDAHKIVTRHRANDLIMAYVPPEEMQLVRDLARHRMFLGEQGGRLKTKIAHDVLKHGHFRDVNPVETQKGRAWLRRLKLPEVTSTLNLLEAIEKETKTAQQGIESYASENPTVQLLTTVPGIGAYSATLILAEVGDFTRFAKAENVGAYAGLVPSRNQSGDHDYHGSITKRGNPTLRWILVEAARNHVIRCPESHLTKHYKHLLETKPQRVALTAAARILGGVLWSMVLHQEPFRVKPKDAGETAAA